MGSTNGVSRFHSKRTETRDKVCVIKLTRHECVIFLLYNLLNIIYRFAFAGGRPVPPNNLRRVSLRANYQILRSDLQATLALVASRRLLVIKDKKKGPYNFYNLANVCL